MNEESLLENLYQEEVYKIPQPPAVVFLPTSWSELSEDDVVLLSKILSSIKLSLAAIRVITQPVININDHIEAYSGNLLLIFGCETNPALESYKNVLINSIHVIKADKLHELDDGRKRNLWLALKQLLTGS